VLGAHCSRDHDSSRRCSGGVSGSRLVAAVKQRCTGGDGSNGGDSGGGGGDVAEANVRTHTPEAVDYDVFPLEGQLGPPTHARRLGQQILDQAVAARHELHVHTWEFKF